MPRIRRNWNKWLAAESTCCKFTIEIPEGESVGDDIEIRMLTLLIDRSGSISAMRWPRSR
jgi:hypothetical protein